MKKACTQGVACRAPEHPATINDGPQAAEYPGGTAGDDPEEEGVGNPGIRIPNTIKDGLPRRLEEEEKERNAEETGQRPYQQRPKDPKEKGTTDGE
ncbi:hypothetical protein NDU88_004424 [Pleurodeles waltl]|uniref:Uncharacterized protein n=1 Tax=Pleurodeles waltl TaxID=8319 RepID=A0AAV7V549_PLEWA|nr:hypothetical protein NDU88_004424 [Pleurodeles waltl]